MQKKIKIFQFVLGVNAFKKWVDDTNDETNGKVLPSRKLKTDLTSMNAEELNYHITRFLKEVRKENGKEYSSDTLYYLCLGEVNDNQFYSIHFLNFNLVILNFTNSSTFFVLEFLKNS